MKFQTRLANKSICNFTASGLAQGLAISYGQGPVYTNDNCLSHNVFALHRCFARAMELSPRNPYVYLVSMPTLEACPALPSPALPYPAHLMSQSMLLLAFICLQCFHWKAAGCEQLKGSLLGGKPPLQHDHARHFIARGSSPGHYAFSSTQPGGVSCDTSHRRCLLCVCTCEQPTLSVSEH